MTSNQPEPGADDEDVQYCVQDRIPHQPTTPEEQAEEQRLLKAFDQEVSELKNEGWDVIGDHHFRYPAQRRYMRYAILSRRRTPDAPTDYPEPPIDPMDDLLSDCCQ